MDIRAQLTGFPRIGPGRELKWVLKHAWSGRTGRPELDVRIAELRQSHLDEQRELVGSAVDDYFLYDEVLETATDLLISSFGELRDGEILVVDYAGGAIYRLEPPSAAVPP